MEEKVFIGTIDQSRLTSECWEIQFKGLEACEDCEYLNTDECGGKEIRESGKNAKDYKVPIIEEAKVICLNEEQI